MDAVLLDLRFAWRTLRRSPGVAALAVLCMALGIGSVTTMYSTANAFTFRPLPQVKDPGGVMHVWEAPASAPDRLGGVSAGALRDLQAERAVFRDVAAFDQWEANISGTDVAERVRGARVSANLLRTLGRSPALGRDLIAAEIGVRVALGASGVRIARLVLGQALGLLGAGLGLGIVGALLTGRAMRAILYETNPADPAVIIGVALLLGAVGLLASWVPTRRALRVHPMEALRYE